MLYSRDLYQYLLVDLIGEDRTRAELLIEDEKLLNFRAVNLAAVAEVRGQLAQPP